MTDGNTYAINKHLDDHEDYDALQEVTAELEQAEARIEALEGKLARALDVLLESVEPSEVEQTEAETKKYHDAWLEVEIVELEAKLTNQTHMIAQLFALLDVTEETEDGRVFHPNQIRSSCVLDAEKLESILAELKGQDDE